MEITAQPLDWTSVDSDNFSKFLDSPTGKRLIPKLADGVPPLYEKGDVNSILIRTGEVRGFQMVLRDLLNLAHPPAPVQQDSTNNYPPPEDDKFWDGPKLNDTNPTL